MAEPTPIESFQHAHEIGKKFYEIQQFIDEANTTGYGMAPVKTNHVDINNNPLYSSIDYFAQTFTGDLTKEYYIRFGYFLKFLQDNIITNIDYDPSIKLINIDYDMKSNIMNVLGYTISSDPKICYIKREYTQSDITYYYIPLAEDFVIPFNDSAIKGIYGYVMNIYFNMTWILTKIDELKDDKGKISLYSLLDALCKGYNESTGNFNKLEPIIDAEENIIRILDDVALPDRDAILKSSLLSGSFGDISTDNVVFDTYGYYYGTGLPNTPYGAGVPHAGFINDLSFTTTVSPELATMITVGSTKQGYVKGQDATALSRMNNGLTDRFKKQITNSNEKPESPTKPPVPLETQYAAALKAFNYYLENLGTTTTSDIPNYDEKSVEDFKNTQTQLIEYQQASSTQAAQLANPTGSFASPNAGFLPFNLSLKMDGISGMKVYQKFLMDTDFLPTNYPGTLEFLIKGITHTIAGDEWTTSIESMAIPKNPFAATGSTNPVDEASRKSNRGEEKLNTDANTSISYYQSNLPPEQAKNRATLTRILDDGTQTLGILEIWDANHVNIIYRLATVELPWKNNQNGDSCIPTGNYLINSRQTAKYGKHFWLVGSESGQWKRIPGANPSDRTWVLIHTAPKAPGWLAGCIGPGPQFDFKRKNTKGNPDGVGTNYLNPAKSESTAALNKLVNTLYNDKGFKMEIKNIGGVSSTALPKSINDAKIKTLVVDAKYKDLFKGI